MTFAVFTLVACVALFGAVLIALEVGRWLAHRHGRTDKPVGTGSVEAAMFGLLGLLVAFTFSGAAQRFDERRHLIIEETNAIGTAYLRVDLLGPEDREPMKASFRNYLDARLAVYDQLPDVAAARAEIEQAEAIQAEIWKRAISATSKLPTPAAMLLLPALNSMFDLANERALMTGIHPPPAIFVMLGTFVIVAGLLAGYAMAGARRSWIHTIGMAVTLALTVYVILNLEYPRLGVIRIDGFDHALSELRQKLG